MNNYELIKTYPNILRAHNGNIENFKKYIKLHHFKKDIKLHPESLLILEHLLKENHRIADLNLRLLVPDDCTLCELHKTRTNVVSYRGNAEAKILLLGEGPGYEEDQQGFPFVGRSGKKLQETIQKLEPIYDIDYLHSFLILNTIKCRTANNANPTQEQLDACSGHFKRQLSVASARIIIALGKVAYTYMTGEVLPVTKFHGIIKKVGKYQIVYTYHPSYVLRNNTKIVNAEFTKDIIRGLKLAGYRRISHA